MSFVQAVAVFALTVMLVEGFALSVFPEQIRQLISEGDSRTLQWAGLFETTLAAVLLIGLFLR